MEPTRAKFKTWGQQGIPELAGVNLGRGSNSGLNNNIKNNYIIFLCTASYEKMGRENVFI